MTLVAARLIVSALVVLGFAVPGQAPAPTGQFSRTADLSSPAGLDAWTLDGNGGWAIKDGTLLLEKAGVPGGPIRRPGALAILQTPALADATLEAEIRSDAPEDVIHRDILLVAGWQSPTRLYYAHLSAVRDNVHNGIFIVDGADRRRIDDESQRPALKDKAWHKVRLVRTASTGRIEVFVDGEAMPIMTATDKTIADGRMGVGSFDDPGAFRGIRVHGRLATP